MLKGERVKDHFASRKGCCFSFPCSCLVALQCAQGPFEDPVQSIKGLSGLFGRDPLGKRTREGIAELEAACRVN